MSSAYPIISHIISELSTTRVYPAVVLKSHPKLVVNSNAKLLQLHGELEDNGNLPHEKSIFVLNFKRKVDGQRVVLHHICPMKGCTS
jgi:hypothetical protein